MSEVLLSCQGLTKRFGGLVAVNEVSLHWSRDEIHAVIGPNGAGKSTLSHLLAGDLSVTTGRITLAGQDVTHLSAEKRSHLGLGRSFQKTNIFLPLSVWENVRLAAQSRRQPWPGNPLAWWRQAESDARVREQAEQALALAGLTHRRKSIAANMSHGEQRQLEIAMCLATEPEVLLLDEPLAGMGVAETERMVELLLTLKPHHAMLLVEHDMDAVFALADRLSVMVNGVVIASGTPTEVRNDITVQAAYLGEEHA
ncbi:MAG: ABC transporter ATP-binding protein [Alphaproteobacteria bacterium]|nr:ABC transporter ATP-binding protein [Alphaproteobacteria bacterium]